jgi:hypothetical protein
VSLRQSPTTAGERELRSCSQYYAQEAVALFTMTTLGPYGTVSVMQATTDWVDCHQDCTSGFYDAGLLYTRDNGPTYSRTWCLDSPGSGVIPQRSSLLMACQMKRERSLCHLGYPVPLGMFL